MNQPTVAPSARFTINGQFVKDLSFENPNAPRSLFEFGNAKPKIDLAIDLKAQRLKDTFFELTLHIEVKASVGEESLFLVDLAYAALVTLIDVPEEHMETMLLAEVPFTVYPFARRVVADITRDGGFPPLLLDPIDFGALFLQSRKEPAPAN